VPGKNKNSQYYLKVIKSRSQSDDQKPQEAVEDKPRIKSCPPLIESYANNGNSKQGTIDRVREFYALNILDNVLKNEFDTVASQQNKKKKNDKNNLVSSYASLWLSDLRLIREAALTVAEKVKQSEPMLADFLSLAVIKKLKHIESGFEVFSKENKLSEVKKKELSTKVIKIILEILKPVYGSIRRSFDIADKKAVKDEDYWVGHKNNYFKISDNVKSLEKVINRVVQLYPGVLGKVILPQDNIYPAFCVFFGCAGYCNVKSIIENNNGSFFDDENSGDLSLLKLLEKKRQYVWVLDLYLLRVTSVKEFMQFYSKHGEKQENKEFDGVSETAKEAVLNASALKKDNEKSLVKKTYR
jgi:hypothetical protein